MTDFLNVSRTSHSFTAKFCPVSTKEYPVSLENKLFQDHKLQRGVQKSSIHNNQDIRQLSLWLRPTNFVIHKVCGFEDYDI